MEKNLTVAQTQNFIVPLNTAHSASDEMEGLSISFDSVKIPSGGSIAFEVPTGDPDRPEITQSIDGVIVDHFPLNVYFAEKFTGEKMRPDCIAYDGKTGMMKDAGVTISCATCPKNIFGSDEDGVGKACKNTRQIFILRSGDSLPLHLNLPPSSIKNFADYIGKRIISKGLASTDVVCRITLKKEQNKGGIVYASAQFQVFESLMPEGAQAMAEYARGIRALTRSKQLIDASVDGGVSEPIHDPDLPY